MYLGNQNRERNEGANIGITLSGVKQKNFPHHKRFVRICFVVLSTLVYNSEPR
jgi:hypothetical protein